MKNKLHYILLSLIVGFSFMNTVFAADDLQFTVSASADKTTVVKGEEATITVALKSDKYINGCTFKVVSDSTLESVSRLGMNNFNLMEGTDTLNIENPSLSGSAPSSGINVLSLKYKVNGDGKVTIKTVECVAPMEEISGGYSDVVVNLTAQDPSEDTTLSSLTLTGGQMSPAFSSTTNRYTVKLDSPNFSLAMTANNSDYQDDIVVTDANGNKLDPNNMKFMNDGGQGLMQVNVTVNNDTTYSLVISYEQTELDNSLASLKVNGQTITLEEGKYEYSVKVGKDVTEFSVDATLKDSVNFQFGSESNAPGSFTISDVSYAVIVVEPKSSQSGAKSVTYNITITKEGVTQPSSSSSSKPSSSQSNSGNATTNPSTGDISMFMMAFILIASLVGSIILYQKNLESYK